jgi:aminoglycoside 6'-N-acetyltransferase I
MKYRESNIEELQQLKTMGKVLWPDSSEEELVKSFQDTFDKPNETILVSQSDTGELAGFTTLSVRSDYVEGATSNPVGYLEGIFVYPGYRKQEVGRHLLELGEKWCREQDCSQIGSDTSITNTDSTEFHLHVGFQVTEKSTCFIKDL